MKNKTIFIKKVDLLLRILPYVMSEEKFALKGGTAINLFMRNMPRLSVDIDLTYLPIENREESLQNIDLAFNRIKSNIEQRFPGIIGILKRTGNNNAKQIVFEGYGSQVKVEINHVLRGSLYPCNEMDLCEEAQRSFSTFTSVKLLSFEDIYAGKICAALDRQHPRDLFDIKLLLENEGISDKLRKAFIIYLISSNRPIVELIDPNLINIEMLYKQELEGMTLLPITYEDLLETRKDLINIINKGLSQEEKQFLLSIKEGNPKWELMDLKNIEKFPAIQWKLINIKKMDIKKRTEAYSKLKEKLCL